MPKKDTTDAQDAVTPAQVVSGAEGATGEEDPPSGSGEGDGEDGSSVEGAEGIYADPGTSEGGDTTDEASGAEEAGEDGLNESGNESGDDFVPGEDSADGDTLEFDAIKDEDEADDHAGIEEVPQGIRGCLSNPRCIRPPHTDTPMAHAYGKQT